MPFLGERSLALGLLSMELWIKMFHLKLSWCTTLKIRSRLAPPVGSGDGLALDRQVLIPCDPKRAQEQPFGHVGPGVGFAASRAQGEGMERLFHVLGLSTPHHPKRFGPVDIGSVVHFGFISKITPV